jgi:4-amino-4-deoxy-L-arabinose transferase-like glycosyltransferase
MNLSRRHLAAVLLICLGTRLIFFGMVHPWAPQTEKDVVLQRDALYYDRLASTLIESHRFAYSATGHPDALRTPLYPLFVAGLYSLFGRAPWVVLLAQILLDVLSCLLLALALARLFDPRVAVIASLFYALDPFLILYSSALISDTLFVFFLVTALYVLSLAITANFDNARLRGYGAASVLLGLATLVRPVSQYIPVVLVLFFLVRYGRRPRVVLKYSAVCVFLFMFVLSPWLVRNQLLFGRFSLSTSGSYNLLVLNVVPMERERRNQDSETVKQVLLSEADSAMISDGKNAESLNEFEKAGYRERLAIEYIRNDTFSFGKFYCLGILHTFWNLGTSEFARSLGLAMAPFDIKAHTNIVDLAKAFVRTKGSHGFLIAGLVFPYLLLSYVGMVAGFVVSWKRYGWERLLPCLLLAIYFVLVTGAAGFARFKLPSIPFYLPFVGIGIDHLTRRNRSAQTDCAG